MIFPYRAIQSGHLEFEMSLPGGGKLSFYNPNLAQAFLDNLPPFDWSKVNLENSKSAEPHIITFDERPAEPAIQPPASASIEASHPTPTKQALMVMGEPHTFEIGDNIEARLAMMMLQTKEAVLERVDASEDKILTRIREQVVLEDCSFSQAANKFIASEQYMKLHKSRKGVYAFVRQSFLDIVGDKNLSELRYKDILHYADMLKHIPPNAKKKPEYAGKNFEAIAREAKAEGAKPMAITTQFKHIKALRNLLHDFMVRFEMGRDLSTCIVSTDYPRNEEQSRQPFTDEELRQIFDHDFMRSLDKPWKFWAILLAFFSGMRVNEIGQIDVEDVCEVAVGVDEFGNTLTVPCISLNRANGKKLKTSSSKRYLPLHSTVIALGFLDFVDYTRSLRFKHLFPDLHDGSTRPGSKISAWFNTTHLKSWCEIDDMQKKFHSFRNHFLTYGELTTIVPLSALKKLTGLGRGRSVERVHYIKDADVAGCKKALEDIVFPKVDFLPYNQTQFASYFAEQVKYAKPKDLMPLPGVRTVGRPRKVNSVGTCLPTSSQAL